MVTHLRYLLQRDTKARVYYKCTTAAGIWGQRLRRSMAGASVTNSGPWPRPFWQLVGRDMYNNLWFEFQNTSESLPNTHSKSASTTRFCQLKHEEERIEVRLLSFQVGSFLLTKEHIYPRSANVQVVGSGSCVECQTYPSNITAHPIELAAHMSRSTIH